MSLVPPKPPLDLHIPPSPNTVKVQCIDTTSRFSLPSENFIQPTYACQPNLKGPSFSFLITHPNKEKHKPILFDLGVRKDWEKLPSYPKFVKLKWEIRVEKGVAEILKEGGGEEKEKVDVDGGGIGAVIWSHHHWDHVGDASTFPSSTTLLVGPGFKAAHLPGYPTNPDSTLLDSDFAGREVREVSFPSEDFKIGRFKALDFFGDGSFYLLDTPGHSIGHICGLARTGAEEFVFMGGDAAHHGGEFRPTIYSPLPDQITLPQRSPSTCPGELLQSIHPYNSATKPFYYVTASFAHEKDVADWTIDGLGEFDAHENVLMLMAHDVAVVDPARLEFYPRSLNGWLEERVGRKVKWLFLEDFADAVERKERGGEPFEWGKYP